jgi:hypothetical protein
MMLGHEETGLHGVRLVMRWAVARLAAAALVFSTLGVAAMSLVGSPANATILYSGGEDIDFTCVAEGSCGISTSTATYRSAWARESVEVLGTSADPPINRYMTPAFNPSSTIWFHAQFCMDYYGCGANNSTTQKYQMIRLMDTSGNAAIIVMGTGTNAQLAIASRTAAGVITTLATCPTAFNIARSQIDVFVNYGATGEVALYRDSVRVCDYTGNVTNGDGASAIDGLELASPTSGQSGAWSEVIVATTDTRAMARFSAYTTGNGNTIGFSGTNVCSSIWSVASYNDANYGYSGSNGIVHECTVHNTIPPGSYSVLGLVMSARALVGSTGPQHFDFVTRTAGTDYTSPDYAPTNSFSNFSNYIQLVNPASGSAWTVSDFEAADFNVGLETKP